MEEKKSGRYLKKRKRFGWAWLIAVLILAALGSGAFWFISRQPSVPSTEPENAGATPASSTADAEATQPAESTGLDDTLSQYSYIFDLYEQAVAGDWSYEQCQKSGISYLVASRENLDGMGFCLLDLDGDGVQEMIISDGYVIYDLYAMVRGRVMWVISGSEQNSWKLCEGNILRNVCGNGAANTLYDYYTWDGAKLVPELNIIHSAASENPWITNIGGVPEALTEEEAKALIDSHPVMSIPVEPIP